MPLEEGSPLGTEAPAPNPRRDGQPPHWSFVSGSRGSRGQGRRLSGERGYIVHAPYARPLLQYLSKKSASYKTAYVLGILTEDQAARLDHWATFEAPPVGAKPSRSQRELPRLSPKSD